MDVTSYLLGKKAGGGSAPVLQDKEVEITENGETTITADSGYDGLSSVDVTTNVQSGGGKYAPNYFSFRNYTGNNLDYETSNLDVSNITNMSNIFTWCQNLTTLDLSNWNTSNVTSMSNMFSNDYSLTTVDLSNIDTSNVNDISYMFSTCHNLLNIYGINDLDTSNVSNMTKAFSSISGIGGTAHMLSLNLSNWNTSNTTTMTQMFAECLYLQSLNLAGFTTEKLTNTNLMFNNCVSLKFLDIRNMDLTTISNYTNMFGNQSSTYVPSYCEIIVKDATQKQWLNTNFSRLTNVKTVAEYEGS